MLSALGSQVEVRDVAPPEAKLNGAGFRNCFFSFYSEISGGNSDLFTAIHSVFSLFGGIAILSVGPVGTALLNLTPQINHEEYAIGKYKVNLSLQTAHLDSS